MGRISRRVLDRAISLRLGTIVLVLLSAIQCGGRPPAWNVLLVTFDTTRADHLGCYGHPRAVTPHVDALAASGTLFRQAYSSLPLTLPSHSTILTGAYPLAHGVRDNGLFVLAEEQLTLAEILSEHGYATGAAIGGFPLEAQFGTAQGFDFYDDHLTGRWEDFRGERVKLKDRIYFDERPAGRVNEAIMPWLEENAARPFFAWVHYYDPHQPQEPPKPYDELFADDPYLGEIAYADESLGRLLAFLEELEVRERTLVVLTADHGEGLGEHRELTHAYLLYNGTLHVPLVMSLPADHELAPAVADVDTRVGSVDILPTVLELLDIDAPEGLQGQSLVSLLRGQEGRDRVHYAESLSARFNNGWGEQRALYDGPWKYVHGPEPELFDLRGVEPEYQNLVASEPGIATDMERKLETFLQRHAAASAVGAVMPDDETRQKLEALGYLQGGGALEVEERLSREGIAPQSRIDDVSDISRIRQALFQGRYDMALEMSQELAAGDESNRYYLELLAQAQGHAQRFDELLITLERIFDLGSTSGTAERLLLFAGQALYFRGETDRGLDLVRDSLARQPTADGHYVLSVLLAAQRDAKGAEAALRNALELDPYHATARSDLAARLAESGDIEAAGQEFSRVVQENPYFPQGHYNRGVFLAQSGDLLGASAALRRAVQLAPDYLEAYHALVVVEIHGGNLAAAEEVSQSLQSRAPEHHLSERVRQLVEEAGR